MTEEINLATILSDLKSDVFEHRLNCAKRLGMIALAIGPDKTRNEFLPLLKKFLDADAEILCVIASELGNMVPFIGGENHYKSLLDLLEQLCLGDEQFVAEAAVASITTMIQTSQDNSMERVYFSFLNRLKDGEFYPAKNSILGLVSPLYKQYPSIREDLVEMYQTISQDSSPMVRECGAQLMVPLIHHLDDDSLYNLSLPVLGRVVEDDLDVVRLWSVPIIVSLFSELEDTDCVTQILPKFQVAVNDYSWKVREKVASALKEIASLGRDDNIKIEIIDTLAKYLKDEEPKVRQIAAQSLPSIATSILSYFNSASTEEDGATSPIPSPTQFAGIDHKFTATDNRFFDKIIPAMELLIDDDIIRVKEALTTSLPLLSLSFGPQKTHTYILPMVKRILTLIRTQDAATATTPPAAAAAAAAAPTAPAITGVPEMTTTLLRNLQHVISVIDAADVKTLFTDYLLPVLEISSKILTTKTAHNNVIPVNNPNSNNSWRIRTAVLTLFPSIASRVEKEWFLARVLPHNTRCLNDDIYSVRSVACKNLRSMNQLWGKDLLTKEILPNLLKLKESRNYLQRKMLFDCIDALLPSFSVEDTEKHLLPLILQLSVDLVPNIRFSLARALHTIILKSLAEGADTKPLSPDAIKKLKNVLQTLSADKDKDVQFFAGKALEDANKL